MKYRYTVQAEVDLGIEEVEKLAALSSCHYDATCRRACLVGGFIYGWFNAVRFRQGPVMVSADEADTICKILEGSKEQELFDKWYGVLINLNTEWERVNQCEPSSSLTSSPLGCSELPSPSDGS